MLGSGRAALAMRVPGQRLTAGPATDGAGGGGCAQSPQPLGWAGPPGGLVLPPRWTGACLLSQGAEGQKPGFGYGARASDYKPAHKGLKGRDAQSALSRIFRLVGGAGAGGMRRLGGAGGDRTSRGGQPQWAGPACRRGSPGGPAPWGHGTRAASGRKAQESRVPRGGSRSREGVPEQVAFAGHTAGTALQAEGGSGREEGGGESE